MNDNVTWFKHAKYGMMIHWGLYSLLAGEYRGESSSAYAEWIQSKFQIPNAEYGKLATAFNPLYFDADQIVALARKCGMQYLVVTTKHHDGFAMYHSQVDRYNVYDATPFHRDVIAELAQACHHAGLKFGLSFSRPRLARTGWRRLQIKRPRNSRHHLGQQLGLPGRNTEEF